MAGTTKTIRTLLAQIDSGELILPEIQRDFIWSKKNVRLLFDSLYRGLPIGYMLVWKAKLSVPSKKFKGQRTTQVGLNFDNFYGYLLDGQQRLTALGYVIDGMSKYKLRFALWPDDEKRPEQNRFVYQARWNSGPWYVAVSDVLSGDLPPLKVIENLESAEDFDRDRDGDAVLASLTKLKAILDYEIGIIEYEDSSYKKATELFIRFNSTGKKLNRSDLAAAELALSVPNLVSKGISKVATKYHPKFVFTKPFLIQCLAAVHKGKMEFSRPRDIWDGSDEKALKASWKRTEKGIARVVNLLTGTIKWDSMNWVPSVNSLIPLVYLLSDKPIGKYEAGIARKWLLSANVHAIFSGSVHSKLDTILRSLTRKKDLKRLWNISKKEFLKIRASSFITKRKSGPIMSLYISMLRNSNAKDWMLGTPLNGTVIGHNAELEVHHFFPRALLLKNGYGMDEINTFANYTVISKESNLKISDQGPSDYLYELGITKRQLAKQYIPLDDSLWLVENYRQFIKERKKIIAVEANKYLT